MPVHRSSLADGIACGPHAREVRLLVIPGLHGSGDAHWQSWLQRQYRHSARVEQADWSMADLKRWSERIGHVALQRPAVTWIAVAHSFGCLALARALREGVGNLGAAIFVAPADPRRFDIDRLLPQVALEVPSAVVASDTDPHMAARQAADWALRWGAHFVNLGDAGHINVESGFGPLPRVKSMVDALACRLKRAQRPRIDEPLDSDDHAAVPDRADAHGGAASA
ncbi:MAG: alpha/beta hydrolase [Burkholderiaceae bacterium]